MASLSAFTFNLW